MIKSDNIRRFATKILVQFSDISHKADSLPALLPCFFTVLLSAAALSRHVVGDNQCDDSFKRAHGALKMIENKNNTGCPRRGGGGIWRGENKYGILKFDCFWQIGICIADSDILHPSISPDADTPPVLGPQYTQLSVLHDSTQSKAVCTPSNFHC